MSTLSRTVTLVAVATAAIIAAGFAAGGFFVGRGILDARLAQRSVTVKGVAEQAVGADLATFPLRVTLTAGDIAEGERRLSAQVTTIGDFLQGAGFGLDEISRQRLEVQDLMAQPYRSERLDPAARYILAQTILVRSAKIDVVEGLSRNMGELVRQGIVFADQGGPVYSLTAERLNQIKPELIRQATAAARAAAAEFAASSGSRVGAIRTANQGVIVILPRDESATVAERHSVAKRVRAVTTIDYGLRD